jgi:hypothetical protein
MTERQRLARCLESFCAYMTGEIGPSIVLGAVVEYAAFASHVPLRVAIIGPRDGVITTLAATDDDLRLLERTAGPHHATFRSGGVLVVADTMEDHHWPNFSAVCVQLGIGSAAAIALSGGATRFGALALLAEHAFQISPVVVAEVEHVVALATAVLVHEQQLHDAQRTVASLQGQLSRRVEIEQAKGVIMGTTRCSADRAAELLIEQSQRENRKLFDVAQDVLRTTVAPARSSPRSDHSDRA